MKRAQVAPNSPNNAATHFAQFAGKARSQLEPSIDTLRGQTCECVGPIDVKCGVCADEASLIPYLRARAGVGKKDGPRTGPMLGATR